MKDVFWEQDVIENQNKLFNEAVIGKNTKTFDGYMKREGITYFFRLFKERSNIFLPKEEGSEYKIIFRLWSSACGPLFEP